MKALTDTFTRARPNERSLNGNKLKCNDFVFSLLILLSKDVSGGIGNQKFLAKGKKTVEDKQKCAKPADKPDYVSRRNPLDRQSFI